MPKKIKEEQQDQNRPAWLLSSGKVDEVEFCAQYRNDKAIAYHNGRFICKEGCIHNEDVLRQDIYLTLREHVRSSIAPRVESILETLRLECREERRESLQDLYTIPVANGTYYLDTGFVENKHVTPYRLPVNYIPDAPAPERWLTFLHQLLNEEDIPTLQEYMGYCLIPTTRAQKMLIITGRGGEGKSRIGVVMKALMGSNMNLGSIAKIEENRFARADLEHILLLVDDDLRMDALKQTNYIKSIITAELPMDLERKGVQSYQGKLCVRFLAFGNETLQALHDRSNGFFRRQIILTAKERSPDRVDDPFLADALLEEKEGILLWCIEGLKRLQLNDFRFTMSKGARRNLLESMTRGNNILEFLRSEGYIRMDPEGSVTSKLLYELYRDWCQDNALTPLTALSFWSYLSQNMQSLRIRTTRSIPIGNGRYARGFVGIRALPRY